MWRLLGLMPGPVSSVQRLFEQRRYFAPDRLRRHPCMYVFIALLSGRLFKKSSDSAEPEDILWEQINPNLDALLPIIANHFGSPCWSQEPLQHGSYARAFLYILQDGLHVLARVILPAGALSKPRQRSLRWTPSAECALS